MSVWPYIPQQGPTEALEWMTDVQRCRAKEYRHCLRAEPRQEWSYQYQMTPAQFARAKESAKSLGDDSFYLPVWTEATHVGAIAAHTVDVPVDATYSCYEAGGYLLVWDNDMHYEVCLISVLGVGTITLNPWVVDDYDDAYVMPVRVATFAQAFEADRDSVAGRIVAQARFLAVETEDLSEESGLEYDTYLGYPVVTARTELIGGSIREEFEREVETLDSGSGILSRGTLYEHAIQASGLGWTLLSQEDLWNFRVWLHTRKGRWKAFWSSSWNNDVEIVKNIAPGDDYLRVTDTDFATHFTLPVDLWVVYNTGFFGVRITSVAYDGPAGTEDLHFTGAFAGETIDADDITCTSKLTFSRFDADRIEVQHKVAASATVEVPIVEIPYVEWPT
jgi:hypothetical protein